MVEGGKIHIQQGRRGETEKQLWVCDGEVLIYNTGFSCGPLYKPPVFNYAGISIMHAPNHCAPPVPRSDVPSIMQVQTYLGGVYGCDQSLVATSA